MGSSNEEHSSRSRKRPSTRVVSEDSLVLIQAGFDHMDEGISMYDSELCLVAWNRAFADLVDFPDDLLQVGRPIADLIRFNVDRGSYGKGDPENILSSRLALLNKRERKTFDRVRTDGEIVEINWFPMPDGGLVITYRDVTDRRAAEDALRESERSLANAQRIAHIGSWELEVETGQVEWSDECFRVFGQEPGQFEPSYETIMPLMDSEGRELVAAAVQDTIDTGEGYELEYKVIRPGGTMINMIGRGEVSGRAPDGEVSRLRGTVQDITERKLADDAVRELNESLESRLALLSERERELGEAQRLAHVGSWEWALDTGEVIWSDHAFRVYGLEPEKSGANYDAIMEMIPPEDAERIASVFEHAIETGEDYEVEHRAIYPDGAVRNLMSRGEISERNADGKPVRLRGTVQDITEAKQAESALRESEERYRGVLMSAADSIITIDEQGIIETLNPAAEKLFGWSIDELVGQPVETIMPESDRNAHSGYVANYVDTREGRIIGAGARQLTGLHKDGHGVPIEVAVNSLQIGDRQLFVGIVRDITERNRAAAVIRKLNEDLENRIELLTERQSELSEAQRLAHVGSWEWIVPTGEVIWSDESCRIFGVEPGVFEATFENITALIPPEDARLIADATARAVETGESYQIEHQVIHPDGSVRHVLERGEVSVRDENGHPIRVRGSMHDITELKKTEEQLLQAQKMEAVGQLTGGVAHDFNNLLAVILGNVEMASERLGENERVQPLLDMIFQAGERGAGLTQRLLAFSRQQVLAPVVIDLNVVLEDTASLLEQTLGEHIEITSALGTDLWRCLADRSQIENAILNLALNARDAMPEGGGLSLETANVLLDADHAAAQADVEPGEYVVLAVSDTGQGISPEHQEHIFEPFFTTKKVGEGSGLGLSMIYGFVKQSGGHMTVDSEIGEGTTFKIYLPTTTEPLVKQSPSDVAGDAQAACDATILVVEDDPNVRTLAVALLSEMGYEVMEARSGPRALQLLEQDHHIDLLLTDVVLPGGINGPALAADVRKDRPEIRVLFMSGYAKQAMAETNRLDGIEAFLQKPFRKQDLADKVREVLATSVG